MALPSWYGDEEPADHRTARLTTITEAIFDVSRAATCADDEVQDCERIWVGRSSELSFLLLAQAYFETRLALHIHEGKCRSHLGECDSGKAIGLWQLQSGAHLPRERWQTLSGTDLEATTRAAHEAARALSRGRNYCRSVAGAISLYATGRTCRWPEAKTRLSLVQKWEQDFRLAQASASPPKD